MKFSLKNQVALGFATSLLALLCLGFISYRTIVRLIQVQDSVGHTHEVLATLETGLAILTDAETAQRGYLLTGDERFLADSQKAQRQVDGWMKKLRRSTIDNPSQQQRLDKLEPIIAQRLAVLNSRIKIRQEQGLEAAATAVGLREGTNLMDQIWRSIGDMRDTENELLASRQKTARERSRQSIAIIFIGGLLSCIVGTLAVLIIRQGLKAREQIENELHKSQAQLQAILDNAPAVVFIKDTAGKYIFVNRRFTEVTGMTREHILGKSVFELFKREIAQAAHGHEDAIMKSGNPQQFEETVNYPDGPHTHLAVKFPLRDANGKIYGTSGISTDISERKRAEQERDRFFTLTRDVLCIANFDGYFTRVNPAWQTIFGFTSEEMLSKPFLDYVHPDDQEATAAEAQKLMEGEETISFENRYRCKDGSYRWLLWNARPLTDLKLIFASGRDVTERKHDEEEIQNLNTTLHQRALQLEIANKELESFSYSVSHDLRAPLRHIDGFVGLLDKQVRDKVDPNSKRHLDIIAKAAKQMGLLIDELLVFSRMGRAEMLERPVDTNHLVQEVVAAHNEEINGRKVEWKIAPLPQVQADAAMLRQVLVNLVSNAIKYSRPRDPAVIEIGCDSQSPLEFTFFVRDNGVGFDMQYANKLFGVFQRLHHADEFEGTGIGLANVRRIIHRHGGRTWAEGQVDRGATLYFTLPKKPTTVTKP